MYTREIKYRFIVSNTFVIDIVSTKESLDANPTLLITQFSPGGVEVSNITIHENELEKILNNLKEIRLR